MFWQLGFALLIMLCDHEESFGTSFVSSDT